jgi:hypothetical protein
MHVKEAFRPPVTSGQSDGLFCQCKIRGNANDFNFLKYHCYFLNELESKFVRPQKYIKCKPNKAVKIFFIKDKDKD